MEEQKIAGKKSVNYGLHLLKILSMFIVISFHFSDHGARAVTSGDPLDFDWLLLSSVRVWGGIVNCVFMLITGYFLSKKTDFSLRRLIQLYAQVWFYSVVFGFLAELLYSGSVQNLDLVRMFFPIITNNYWYFSSYVIVYLFYPFSNRLIAALSRNQHRTLCVLSILLFSVIRTLCRQAWLEGTNWIYLFFILYFTGAYLRKYPFKLPYKWIVLLVLFGMEFASILCCRALELRTGKTGFLFFFVWGAEKIFPVSISLVLFKCFEAVDIRNEVLRKGISFIAPAVFGVYLFHIGDMYKWLFWVLFNDQETHGILLLLKMISSMVTIFVVGIAIDLIRIRFLERPFLKLFDRPIAKMDEKARSFYN